MVLPKYFLLTARKILILPKSSKLGGAIAPPAPPAGTAMSITVLPVQPYRKLSLGPRIHNVALFDLPCIFPSTFLRQTWHRWFPVDPNSRDHPQDYLSAVNGSSVPTFGCKNITINLGGPVPLNGEFCIAETLKPIIGIDFLSHFDIKIDSRRGRLNFPNTYRNLKILNHSACFIDVLVLMHRMRDPCFFLSNTELKPSLCNVEPPV